MPKIDLICPVCGHTWQIDDGHLKFFAKHCAGEPLCSRRCVNLAELAADAQRPADGLGWEHLMRRGTDAPSHRKVRSPRVTRV